MVSVKRAPTESNKTADVQCKLGETPIVLVSFLSEFCVFVHTYIRVYMLYNVYPLMYSAFVSVLCFVYLRMSQRMKGCQRFLCSMSPSPRAILIPVQRWT